MDLLTGEIDVAGKKCAFVRIKEELDILRENTVVQQKCLNQAGNTLLFTHTLGDLLVEKQQGDYYYRWYVNLNTIKDVDKTEPIRNDIEWLNTILEGIVRTLDNAEMIGG